MTTPDYEQTRQEARSHAFRKMMKSVLGTSCYNCGSSEYVEYHHIVPLKLGGTNRFSNIVPLCHKCHKAAHEGRHIHDFVDFQGTNPGRKPKIPDEEAFKAYDLLVDGQIGNKKLWQMLNLGEHTHPNQTMQYKRYLAARGIKSVRSNFDVGITLSWNTFADGRVVGYVVYESGEKKDIIFHDTGLNDDVEYEFCDQYERSKKFKCTWGELKNRARRKAEEFSELSRQFYEDTRNDHTNIVDGRNSALTEPCLEEPADTTSVAIGQEEHVDAAGVAIEQEGTVESEEHTEPTEPVETTPNTGISAEELKEYRERDAVWWREYRKKMLKVV